MPVTRDLKVGRRGFTLPVDMVTKTMGILAVKRSGKSNAAVVMAEEMFDAGVPWVAIDPKGDWWGIKAQGIHNDPGLPVAVFGGEHGDLPLEPTAGAYVADLIAEQHLTCVLDVSEFNSKADQRRFLTDFATRLYKVNREPLHVFCEEADEYIPQKVGHDETKMVGAFETLVKRGGFRGIGITLVTQRSASLNKDVLTQVGTLFAMRTTGPLDRKAIRDWVDWHDAGADLVKELPRLAAGEAYIFSPEDLGIVQKIHFRVRRTFDSGATPEVGKKRIVPKTLAEVDLDAIREAMADTIERVKQDDPKYLKAEITRLTTALRGMDRQLEEALSRRQVETVEVPVISDEMLAEFQHILSDAMIMTSKMTQVVENAQRSGTLAKATSVLPTPRRSAPPTSKPTPPSVASSAGTSNGSGDLNGPQTKILTALAQHGPQEKKALAIRTGYAHRGGAFNNPIGKLRSLGYISAAGVNPIEITSEGREALGKYEPLPEGSALLEWWMPQLRGPEQKIVSALAEQGPMSKEVLAEATGYAPTGGAFNNPLGRLRTLGVITPAGVKPIDLAEEMRDW